MSRCQVRWWAVVWVLATWLVATWLVAWTMMWVLAWWHTLWATTHTRDQQPRRCQGPPWLPRQRWSARWFPPMGNIGCVQRPGRGLVGCRRCTLTGSCRCISQATAPSIRHNFISLNNNSNIVRYLNGKTRLGSEATPQNRKWGCDRRTVLGHRHTGDVPRTQAHR